jgi:hypothetical protein
MRSVRLLVVSVFMSLILFVPIVRASASVVQQNSVNVSWGASKSLAFTSSVTSGNVVVVAILTYSHVVTVSSVTDSLGSRYAQAVERSDIMAADTAAIYYATLSSTGSCTVTVTVSNAADWDMYIFEVSGVTATGVSTGSGAGYGTAVATSSTSFTQPAFLLAVVGTAAVRVFTAGLGFTAAAEPSGDLFSHVEYSTSGMSSATTFPGTISSSDYWVEVGAAFFSAPAAVGGVVMPANSFAIVAPWLAVIGVVGCIGVVVVVVKRRR